MIDLVERLIQLLRRLPGIGYKSAQRIVIYLLQSHENYILELINTIKELKSKVKRCKECGNLGIDSLCDICKDPKRDTTLLCVVAYLPDLWAVERSGIYNGLYHLLNGLLSPLNGIGYEKLNLGNLKARIRQRNIKEVILALPPTVEGEATTVLIKELLQGEDIKITRLASGIPHGMELEYTDKITLSKAFEGRREV